MKEPIDPSAIDLVGFYAGDRELLTHVYRSYVAMVERAVTRYCRGVDAEGIVHEVFLSLVEKPEVRKQFTGGNMGAWLATMASRRALDYLRRNRRWMLLNDPRSLEGLLEPIQEEESLLAKDQTQRLQEALALFSTTVLPELKEELVQVYELRFQERLSQVEAAERLRLPRSTFIDRETRLMKKLGRFLKHYFVKDE